MATVRTLLLVVLILFANRLKGAEQDSIGIIVNDWTSQIVMAYITGQLFESVGHKVRYSFSNTNQQWGALSFGIDHVQVEVWQGTMSEMFERAVKSGKVIDAGTHDAKTREDWWYPDYVESICKGLPDWRALNKCSSEFSNSGDRKGLYIAGPWEKPEAARIRALKMNFKVKTVTHADELWVLLKEANAKRQPIVMFNWTPNWVEAVYPGKFIEFPEYHPDCETEPGWGINPNFHQDCGNPKNGWLKKAAWHKMPDKWPCAYQILQNINFNNQGISKLAAAVDFYGKTPMRAAKEWITDNESVWRDWLPSECDLKESSEVLL